MSYSYYHSVPGWGTNQFQFGAPPAPTFQPQPSWGGLDYYRAHAHSPDPDLYGHAWSRVRDFRAVDYTSAAGLGVGIHEARHWHRRAYGGLAELNTLLAPEIGHAAAYEAYRTWIHNSSIYEPLSGETERQREGLIGLAVAEATRLLSYTPRLNMDPYTRQTASESAAMTASILFYWSRDHNDDEYRGRSGYGSDYDPYSYDTNVMYPHRGRSRSRHRSLSVSSYNRVPSMGGSAVGMPSGGMMGTPYPGQAGSYMGQPGGYPGQPGSYPGQSYVGSQYGGGGGGGMPVPMSAGGYATSDPAGGYGTPYPGQGSGVPMVVPPMGGRPRSMSMSVPYAPMQGTPYPGGTVMSNAPPAQVVVVKSHKKHRHHHHSSRRSRSRSRY